MIRLILRGFCHIVLICLLSLPVLAREALPKNIQWITNDTAPVYASPDALKGGTFRSYITSFPMTLRHVGPDSNGEFAHVIFNLDRSLMSTHPNTEEPLPDLATHWAFDPDKKTMYFKLDPTARWSDGKPVTASDYVYTLEFMRSKNLMAPFYNNFYTEMIDKVTVYDDVTIAISATKPRPDLYRYLALSPTPRHFYGDVPEDYVRRFNWKVPPNTGAYDIDKVNKGKSITLKRKEDWWGKDHKYFKGRFNVDKIRYTVIRDVNAVFEYFKKGKIDYFSMVLPSYWHDKAKDMEVYQKGYVKKLWFYTDAPEGAMGFWLNQGKDLFKDKNVRYAFAHAINMEKLLSEVLRGDYSRLHNGYSGYGDYTNSKIKAREYDLKKVAGLMSASNWKRGLDGIWEKNGARYSVQVTYSAEHHTQRLVVLKEEAKKAGIELILKRMDGSAAWKLNLDKKHEVAWTGFSASLKPRFWQTYHSDNALVPNTNNFTNTADLELDSLIERYRVALEDEERIGLSHQIQEKIYDIGAFIPAYKVGYFRGAYWRWWQLPDIPATKLSSSAFEELGSATFWMDEAIRKETQKAMKSGKTYDSVLQVDTTYKVD